MRLLTNFIVYLLISGPAFSAVTAYVPTCCNSKSTVSIISTTQNRVTANFTVGSGAYSIAFAPNGLSAWVAEAGSRSLTVLSLPSYLVIANIPLRLQPWSIQASPDGRAVYVVTGNFEGNLDSWPATLIGIDIQTYAIIADVAIPNVGSPSPGLVISPDSSRVYATLDSQNIIVWDAPTQSLVDTWTVLGALAWTASGTLTLSPDGLTLYNSGQVLTAINTASGDKVGTAKPPGISGEDSFVGSAVTNDGSTLYAAYASTTATGGGVAILDTASLAVVKSVSMPGVELQQPILTKDNATLYVPDAIDSVIYVVDPSLLSVSSSIAVTGNVATATLGVYGQSLFVPNQSTSGLVEVDPVSLQVRGQTTIASGPSAAVSAKNGSRIYVAGYSSNTASDFSTKENRLARSFTVGAFSESVSGYNPTIVVATPDGSQLYIGSGADQFQFVEIDTATGTPAAINCPYSYCDAVSIAAAPNGEKVYISGNINDFEGPVPPFFLVINTQSKRVVKAKRLAAVGAMAVAPSGSYLYLAAGSTVRVYDTATDMFTGSIAASGVASIAFTPDGTKAYCSAGSAVLVIDTASNMVTASIELSPAKAGAISASPDGSQVWVALASSTSVAVIETSSNTFQTVDVGGTVNGVAFGVQ